MTDPFDTVRAGLADLSPPFGTLPKARAALASIEARLRVAESELAQWRDSIATEALVERVRVAELERDEWKEKWKRTHERLGIALGVDDPLSEEDVDKLAGAAVAGLRRGQMRVAPQEEK